MPIKAENKHLYPSDWNIIRRKILFECQNKCEFCGVQNYSIGYRDEDGKFVKSEIGEKLIKIVLTIAHLDHNPQNNSRENLRALCQKCHLNYDAEHHKETRLKTKNSNQTHLDLWKRGF